MEPGGPWFKHMLALALGKSIREVMESMDGREFASWKRFYELFPFGPIRGDLQAGNICRYIAASNSRRSPPDLDKFIIRRERVQRKKSANDGGKSELQSIAALSGIPFSDGSNVDR